MPPKNTPPSKDLRDLFGLPKSPVCVRSTFEPPVGINYDYAKWKVQTFKEVQSDARNLHELLVRQASLRGFHNHQNAKNGELLSWIKSFDRLVEEDDKQDPSQRQLIDGLILLAKEQPQAEQEEEAPENPPEQQEMQVEATKLQRLEAQIQQILREVREKEIADMEKEQVEPSTNLDEENESDSEEESATETTESPPARKRQRKADHRHYDRDFPLDPPFPLFSKSDFMKLPSTYFESASPRDPEGEALFIPPELKTHRPTMENMEAHPWLKPTVHGFLCRCCSVVASSTTTFVGKPLPWEKVKERLTQLSKEHGTSGKHIACYSDWRKNVQTQPPGGSLPSMLDRGKLASQVLHTQFLVQNILALISAIKRSQPVTENVNAAIRLFGMMDSATREMLSHSQNLSSPGIHNEMRHIIAEHVRDDLSDLVKKSSYVAVISDESQDIKKKEQLAIFLKIWDHSAAVAREIFWSLQPLDAVDAEGITEHLEDHVDADIWPKVLFLSFDGANTMRGELSGVQARLRALLCPRSQYVWCSAHKLNLICLHSAAEYPDVSEAYSLLGDLYRFLYRGHSCEKLRTFKEVMAALKSISAFGMWRDLEIQSVGSTRWISHERAAHTVCRIMMGILRTLQILSQGSDPKHQELRNTALSLFHRLVRPVTMGSLLLLDTLSPMLVSFSKSLQSSSQSFGDLESIRDYHIALLEDLRDHPANFQGYWQMETKMNSWLRSLSCGSTEDVIANLSLLKSASKMTAREIHQELASMTEEDIAEDAANLQSICRYRDLVAETLKRPIQERVISWSPTTTETDVRDIVRDLQKRIDALTDDCNKSLFRYLTDMSSTPPSDTSLSSSNSAISSSIDSSSPASSVLPTSSSESSVSSVLSSSSALSTLLPSSSLPSGLPSVPSNYLTAYHSAAAVPFINNLLDHIKTDLHSVPMLSAFSLYDPRSSQFGVLSVAKDKLDVIIAHYSKKTKFTYEGKNRNCSTSLLVSSSRTQS